MDHNADLKLYMVEARQLDNPNITYVEKKIKGAVDRVTAVLKGTSSANATRLAGSYRTIERITKELNDAKADQNALIKSVADKHFDPVDAVLTRVLESIQFVLTLSKEKHTPASSKDIVDNEAILKELSEQMPDLISVLAVLTKKHTTTKPIPAKTTPSRLTVKHHDEIKTPKFKSKQDESLVEGRNEQWVDRYIELAQEKLHKFDTMMNQLKNIS